MEKIQLTAFELAQRFVGLRDITGPTSNPAVLAMLQLDAGTRISNDETPWCFSGDVEVLTDEGFCRLDAIRDDVRVAQVDPFFGVSFTQPIGVIRHTYEGALSHFDSRDFGLTCDTRHRFFGVWNRANVQAGAVELRPLSDLTSNLHIPAVRSTVDVDDSSWTDRDLQLFAAFLSDGFVKHQRIEVQVSKVRKIEALTELGALNVYQAPIAYGQSTMPLTTFSFARPQVIAGACDGYKHPKWALLSQWSVRQLRLFVDTYVTFDGHARGGSRSLYTSDHVLRDWLQVAVTLAGFHSSTRQSSASPYSGRPCYEVVFSPDKRTRTMTPDMVTSDYGVQDLYCVQVPSGVIVIRDPKGTVIPVGNCSAFVNYVAWLLRLPRSKSLAARSWLSVGVPVAKLADAQVGFDIVVLTRAGATKDPRVTAAPGHVGFFAGYDAVVHVLGGNQSDAVSVASYAADDVIGIRRLVI